MQSTLAWGKKTSQLVPVFSLKALDIHHSSSNFNPVWHFVLSFSGRVDDFSVLLAAMLETSSAVTDVIVEDNRRRHVAFLLSEQGSWRGDLDRHVKTNKMKLTKRSMKRSKSVVDLLLFPGKSGSGSGCSAMNEKSKNIQQTEVLINLRDAILRVSQYFQVGIIRTYP